MGHAYMTKYLALGSLQNGGEIRIYKSKWQYKLHQQQDFKCQTTLAIPLSFVKDCQRVNVKLPKSKSAKRCPAFLSKLAKMIRNITSLRCSWKMMNMSQIQSREWQLHIMWRPRRSLILPSNMHHFKFLGSVYYLAETVIKNQRLFSPLWE